MLEPNPLPALVLYGPEDHVIPRDFPERMERAFPEIVGPFVVEGAGPLPDVGAPDRAESCNCGLLPGPAATIVPAMSEETTAPRASELAASKVEEIVTAAGEAAAEIRESAEAEARQIARRRRGSRPSARARRPSARARTS